MAKSEKQDNYLTKYYEGIELLQEPSRAVEAKWAFVAAEITYQKAHGLGREEVTPQLASILLQKAKAVRNIALSQAEKGNYSRAIESHKSAYMTLKRAEAVYMKDIAHRQSYKELYEVMIQIACGHKDRSDCHEELKDAHGSRLAASAAIRQISAVEKGYASYLSAHKIESKLLLSMKEEMQERINHIDAKEQTNTDNVENKLSFSARVTKPCTDLSIYVQDNRKATKRKHAEIIENRPAIPYGERVKQSYRQTSSSSIRVP